MIWFIAEDIYWYRNFDWYSDFLKQRGKNAIPVRRETCLHCGDHFLLLLPSPDEVTDRLRKGDRFDVLACNYPPKDIETMFVIHKLPNRHKFLTSQEYEYSLLLKEEDRNKYEREKLADKLGLKIYQPQLNSEDLVGLNGIKRFIYKVKIIDDNLLRPRGIFLVGVPGTGKSYSAKYAASLLNYYLVEMNIARIIESDRPIELLHDIFKYLEEFSQTQDRGVVLWIDEIEKMFAGMQSEASSKRIFGQLLTVLNDFNSEMGYKIKGIFFVTANNIKDIVENNPEFLRKGRFDELFFLDTPRLEDARNMFSLYRKKYTFPYRNKKLQSFEQEAVDMVQLIYSLEASKYGSKDVTRFIYTPAEIENIVKEMASRYILRKSAKNGDRDILYLLYSKREFQKVNSYIKNTSNYEEFIEKAQNFVTDELDHLDLCYVIIKNDPLTIRLRESIAFMRSQERFFSVAD